VGVISQAPDWMKLDKSPNETVKNYSSDIYFQCHFYDFIISIHVYKVSLISSVAFVLSSGVAAAVFQFSMFSIMKYETLYCILDL
jgi:hypothetical protein